MKTLAVKPGLAYVALLGALVSSVPSVYADDAIVLDLGLPDASGHVVASQLRNDGRARFPIVVLSGKSCASERAMAGQLGAAAYLLKPYDPGELLRVIATLVRGLDRQAEAAGPPFASPSMLPAQLAPVPANERCRP
mgnify:CR=1 FL=1